MKNENIKSEIMAQLNGLLNVTDSIERVEAKQFMDVFSVRYEAYTVKNMESDRVKSILQKNQQIKIEVWGGNWCSDTHDGIPVLAKILDEWQFPVDRFTYRRVSRDRMSIDGVKVPLYFGAVPRVKIWNEGVLIGEIIEFPKKSWEEDLQQSFFQLP